MKGHGLLRSRVLRLGALAALLLALVIATPLLIALEQQAARSDAMTLDRAQDAWVIRERMLAPLLADQARRLGEQLLAGGGARSSELPALALLNRSLTEPLTRVDLVRNDGQVVASTDPAQQPLIDGAMLAQLKDRQDSSTGLTVLAAGAGPQQLLLVTALALDAQTSIITAIDASKLAARITPSLEQGYSYFLTDTRSALLATNDAARWPGLTPKLPQVAQVKRFDDGEHSMLLTSQPLDDLGGYPVAMLHILSQAPAQNQLLLVGVAGALALALLAVLGVALHATLRGALDPLESVSRSVQALSAGDLFSSPVVQQGDAEVRQIAQAVAVFHDNALALARRDFDETLQRAQHRALIDQELRRLTASLDPAEQEALEADLRDTQTQAAGASDGAAADESIGRALRLMTSRVLGQQDRLRAMLEERTRDLQVVRQALAERQQLSRLREELEVAQHLQTSHLPRREAAQALPPSIDLHALMRPAKEVGGDMYDFVMLDERRLMLVVGDASGKGISAAMFVMMTRALLRAAAGAVPSPARCLALANATLSEHNDALIFCTLFLAVLDLPTGQLVYANAGHNPPWLRHANGSAQRLALTGDIMLGVIADYDFTDASITLVPGDTLVMYSDGVTEAHDPQSELFGDQRLAQALPDWQGAGAQSLSDEIMSRVDRFVAGAEQSDDITLMTVGYGARAVPPPN